MKEIQYMEKPDWVSWDDIHECLYQAHQRNRSHGLNMTSQDMSGDILKKKLAENGHCFVAMCDNKVVGVNCLTFPKICRWWRRGVVAYNCLDGIIPEYQGTDVYFGLQELRTECIKQSGVKMIQSNTAEDNKLIIKIVKKKGFKVVQYSATAKGADHYSVIMVKWLDGCPYPDWFCNFMFKMSKAIIKAIWKPGYKLRWL